MEPSVNNMTAFPIENLIVGFATNQSIFGENEHIANETHRHNITEGHLRRNPFLFIPTFPLPTFIIQLVIIVCMSRLVKLFLTPFRQPAVIAEIISGIILGPTVFGHIPYFSEFIFPPPSLPLLNLMSNFGLVLFLFLVGLELDLRMLKKSINNSLPISLAGMALPFAMGAGVSYILYTYIEPPTHQNGFTKYFLLLGVAMAITAFPVLARILSELNLLKTKVGSITISAAAIDDATSWCLLALVISLINAGSGLIALYVFLMGLAYSLFLVFGVRPIFTWFLRRHGAFEDDNEPSQAMMFFTLMIVFISAFITDAIGVHAIFGGFLAGIIMTHEGEFAYHITQKLEDIVAILFLPLYFALSGLRTSIGSLDDLVSWGIVLLVCFVACFGKIFGCTLAAKATRMNWRESMAVGCLMNCKGLVELIVLNLGYDAHVISQRTFTIMVIMALVTTFITVPAVSFIYPPIYHDKPEDHKDKGDQPNLLVFVNKIEQVAPILSIINLLQSKLNLIDSSKYRKMSTQSQTSLSSVPLPNPGLFLPVDGEKPSKSKSHSSGFTINVLRLIELTQRDSSVMLQTSQNGLKDDAVTKIFSTFCEMSKTTIRNLVEVVPMSKFGEALIATANEVHADYILIPWSGSGSITEDTTFRHNQCDSGKSRRPQSVHTSSQHSNFIQYVLSGARCTVLILVDRGLEPQSRSFLSKFPESMTSVPIRYQQIYFPYFGGADDRKALEIVMGLSANQGVQINIVRYKNIVSRSFSEDSDPGSSSDGTTVHPEVEGVVTDSNYDNELLTHFFGFKGTTNVFSNILYIEVESYTSVSTAVQYMAQLSSEDLVVIGKGSAKMQNCFQNFKNGDAERRRILGDVSESIMLCSCGASVLIVQANRMNKNGANGV